MSLKALIIPFINLAGKLVDGAKWLFTINYIRKAEKTEVKNEILNTQNRVQKEQLKIASKPSRMWSDLLKRMRKNKL